MIFLDISKLSLLLLLGGALSPSIVSSSSLPLLLLLLRSRERVVVYFCSTYYKLWRGLLFISAVPIISFRTKLAEVYTLLTTVTWTSFSLRGCGRETAA
jgi:hypothetical protein